MLSKDENYYEFIRSRDNAKTLGVDLFEEVVTAYSTKSFVLQRSENTPTTRVPNTYLEDWKRIHHEMIFSDACAVIGSDRVPFHRAVLAAQSDSLHEFLRKNKRAEVNFSEIIRSSSFRSLLRFIYYGDTLFAMTELPEILKFATHFKISHLEAAYRSRKEQLDAPPAK